MIYQSVSCYQSNLICSLSLSSTLIKQIWQSIDGLVLYRSFGPAAKCIDQLCHGISLPYPKGVVLLELLSTFCSLLFVSLSSLHDGEVASLGPFGFNELAFISLKLRDLFVVLHLELHLPTRGGGAYFKTTPTIGERPHPNEWNFLANVS